jgi:hypothetical protein
MVLLGDPSIQVTYSESSAHASVFALQALGQLGNGTDQELGLKSLETQQQPQVSKESTNSVGSCFFIFPHLMRIAWDHFTRSCSLFWQAEMLSTQTGTRPTDTPMRRTAGEAVKRWSSRRLYSSEAGKGDVLQELEARGLLFQATR